MNRISPGRALRRGNSPAGAACAKDGSQKKGNNSGKVRFYVSVAKVAEVEAELKDK